MYYCLDRNIYTFVYCWSSFIGAISAKPFSASASFCNSCRCTGIFGAILFAGWLTRKGTLVYLGRLEDIFAEDRAAAIAAASQDLIARSVELVTFILQTCNAVPLTPLQVNPLTAALLQGFPAKHPWRSWDLENKKEEKKLCHSTI